MVAFKSPYSDQSHMEGKILPSSFILGATKLSSIGYKIYCRAGVPHQIRIGKLGLGALGLTFTGVQYLISLNGNGKVRILSERP